MEHADTEFLGGGGDEKVGDLSPPLAPLGEKTLNLQLPAHMHRARLHRLEGVEGADQLIHSCAVGAE